MNKLQSVRLQRFKRISDAPFDLSNMNVLVGANNSGKSSIIQGLHFGIGLLQIIRLITRTPKFPPAISLNPTQLIYSPSENVYALGAGAKLVENEKQAVNIEFVLSSGDKCTITVKKGRNRNIQVAVENTATASTLASLENPFSIFSPGLAGISKAENYVSDGVLLRTLARGDANLILRNILLRLWEKEEQWQALHDDLHEIFPGIELFVQFNRETDEFISVRIKVMDEVVPLDLAGTGILQATQILSYIHKFAPNLVVLDEPDSHLHPNNQRLLCSLLRRVAEERNTQIILTTHSRHVVDALASSSKFLWVRDGTVDTAGPDDEIGILLDIGALDIKERASRPETAAVILTEDENTRQLKVILEASGFNVDKTIILPYYGVTSVKNLRPLVSLILAANPSVKIVLHRDSDYLTEEEVAKWEKDIRGLNVEPFLTDGVDIESHFLKVEHLININAGVSKDDFSEIFDETIKEVKDELIRSYVNGRIDIERKVGNIGKLDTGKLAVEAPKIIDANPGRFLFGKKVLPTLCRKFRDKYGLNMQVFQSSQEVSNKNLAAVAIKVFGIPKKAIKTKK
jgi:energy-coupling factor transporter ATP-binding protein EcfA2